MGRISEIILNSLFMSSAYADNFRVRSCNDDSTVSFYIANELFSIMGLCKIDSWIWTIFSFVLHMMTWWSVLVMVPTVFDKTQARARKSIFCLKSYKNVAVNHLELIRDKLKILFGAENSGLKWYTFQKWDRFYM